MSHTHVSYLSLLSDKAPKLVTLEQVFNRIIDPKDRVAVRTLESRRQRKLGNDERAKELKKSCGMIVPSAFCEGGHQQEHIIGLTQMVMVDLDKIPLDQMDIARAKVMTDEHTCLCHITNSERGLRVIALWEMVDETGCLVPGEIFLSKFYESQKLYLDVMTVIHDIAFRKINDYYSALTGLPYDRQTCNINRGAFLCHDPKAYFNPEAVPFFITKEEVSDRLRQVGMERRRREAEKKRMYEQQRASMHKYNRGFTNDFDLVEYWVSQRVVYAPGSRNNYICRCCYLLHERGISEDVAMQWALARFSVYPSHSVASTVRSCYRKRID